MTKPDLLLYVHHSFGVQKKAGILPNFIRLRCQNILSFEGKMFYMTTTFSTSSKCTSLITDQNLFWFGKQSGAKQGLQILCPLDRNCIEIKRRFSLHTKGVQEYKSGFVCIQHLYWSKTSVQFAYNICIVVERQFSLHTAFVWEYNGGFVYIRLLCQERTVF